jgi:hypothetical protein
MLAALVPAASGAVRARADPRSAVRPSFSSPPQAPSASAAAAVTMTGIRRRTGAAEPSYVTMSASGSAASFSYSSIASW